MATCVFKFGGSKRAAFVAAAWHHESTGFEDPAGDEGSKLLGISTHQRLLASDWCALRFERMLCYANNYLGLYAEQTGLQFEVSRQ